MRLVRFNRHAEAPVLARLGAVLPGDVVADLRAGYAAFLQERGESAPLEIAEIRIPLTLGALVAAGGLNRPELGDVIGWLDERRRGDANLRGPRNESLLTPLGDCRLHAPVRLTNLFVANGNYGPAPHPSFEAKPTGCTVGPSRDIRWPPDLKAIACETGLAVVIGRTCRDLRPAEAMDAIAGYFVMTSVRPEAAAGQIGGYETFTPSGPALVTAEEVRDPMGLAVEMRVNGELRRRFSTVEMTWGIGELVAHLSRITLQAGDVIWTGGVSASPDEPPIQPGDVIEGSVAGIGAIRNRVVREAPLGAPTSAAPSAPN